jgi:hypothetical protein
MSVRYFSLGLIAAALGCATTSATPGVRRDSKVITAQEIATVDVASAYDLIERLRPSFLRSRGQTSLGSAGPDYPNVYINGQRYGEINSLRTIVASQVLEVRYYNAADGATKFGLSNTGGVIELKLR